MILNLLLIIISGIVVLASIGIVILGLVKKRKKILIISAILFIVGAIGFGISIFNYTKRVVKYVTSNEFQNDTKKSSELVGRTIGSVSSGVSKDLATSLDDEAIASLAKKSAIIFGKSIKTIASNFDSTLGNKNIFLDSSLANSGFKPGRAEEKYNPNRNDLEIFVDYKKDFKGKLRATNYDQTGKKIDVSEIYVNSKAGQGKVEVFSFPHSNLGLTTYYILSKVG